MRWTEDGSRPVVSTRRILCAAVLVVEGWLGCGLLGHSAHAQDWGRRRSRGPTRSDFPQWEIDPRFGDDVFCFARIEYDAFDGWNNNGWRNDYPDCDWNFSLRLQQLTSMQVDPNGVTLRLTDPALLDHPFAYMSNINQMRISNEEVLALRRYLENGGFLMADDFWSAESWRHVKREMARVFPDRPPQELSYDHPIFHIVYDVAPKPQVPGLETLRRGYTFEYHHGDPEGDTDPHFQAYLDRHGNVVALFCHNNDIGDGWEREGVGAEYFHKYAEQISYPLGINIVTYALTH